jgi:Ser/Thr protein kinase RdoA (MazF antagonist)
MLTDILNSFGLQSGTYISEKLNSGLINQTWKISTESREYILQQVNKNVFKSPGDIVKNITALDSFLGANFPDYLFVSLLKSPSGEYMVQDGPGEFYRLMPFVKNSKTFTVVTTKQEAYEAAHQFGKFTSLLSDFDISKLSYTLPDFHNLKLRFEQFKQAYRNAAKERLDDAESAIRETFNHQEIVQTYKSIVADRLIPLRVIHHDTKISNVLFDKNHLGICVIDLDTVMPGYFFSDVGDMMRTYLSPANEEEKDFSKISIREGFFQAIMEGYCNEMAPVLTQAEKELFIYSGKFMIYMQAIRFLTDFLNGDIYYSYSYPKHNLVRAQNQFVLLNRYIEAKENFYATVHRFWSQAKTEIIS